MAAEQIYINGTAYMAIPAHGGTTTVEETMSTMTINSQDWIIINMPVLEYYEQPAPYNKKQVPFHVQQNMRKKKGNKRGFR